MIYQGFDPHLKVTLDLIQLRVRLTQYRIKFWQQLVLTVFPRQTNRKLRNVLDELFECDVCKARFTLKRSMKMHKDAVHDGVRAFQCTWCDMALTQGSRIVNFKIISSKNTSFQSSQ